MKIAISGAHSQGKTTLVNALKNEPIFKDYTFCTNLTRNLKDAGLPINEAGTEVTQMAVMMEHFKRLSLGDNLILDRCALDGLAYSAVVVKSSLINIIGQFAEFMLQQYDHIFYIEPELPLIDDGTRTTNALFFKNVVNMFDASIYTSNPAIKSKITRISGSTEERIAKIINAIELKQIKNNIC